mmetsp:Transcript_21041/g.39410  ORF Transcript_21041/g.39410 Transcript_21041/m.39410 type:complete len:239 (-) Transcript_21041:2114-2830(-)
MGIFSGEDTGLMSSGAWMPMSTICGFSLFFLGGEAALLLGRSFFGRSFFCSSLAIKKNLLKNSAPSTVPSASLSKTVIKAPISGYENRLAKLLWRHFLNSSGPRGGPAWKASSPMLLAAVRSNLNASSLIFFIALILSFASNFVFSMSFLILSRSMASSMACLLASMRLCFSLLSAARLSLSWCLILKNWLRNSAPSTSPSPSLSKMLMTAPSSPGLSFNSKVRLSISLKTWGCMTLP